MKNDLFVEAKPFIAFLIRDAETSYLAVRYTDGKWEQDEETVHRREEIRLNAMCTDGISIVLSSSSQSCLAISNNGGVSYTTIPYTEDMIAHRVNDIYAATHGLVVACGNDGYIYASCDGDFLWQTVQAGELTQSCYNSISICLANKGTVVAVGNDGVIALSDDSGKTFSLLDIGIDANWHSVFIRDKDNVIIGGDRFTIADVNIRTGEYCVIAPPENVVNRDSCIVVGIYSFD